MSNEEKIALEGNNEEITELTAEEAANVQGGFWWFFQPKKKSYATGNRAASSTYRA
jgi:hypothetical protein